MKNNTFPLVWWTWNCFHAEPAFAIYPVGRRLFQYTGPPFQPFVYSMVVQAVNALDLCADNKEVRHR